MGRQGLRKVETHGRLIGDEGSSLCSWRWETLDVCLHPESDTQMVCLDVAELQGIHSHQRTERLPSYKLMLVAPGPCQLGLERQFILQ